MNLETGGVPARSVRVARAEVACFLLAKRKRPFEAPGRTGRVGKFSRSGLVDRVREAQARRPSIFDAKTQRRYQATGVTTVEEILPAEGGIRRDPRESQDLRDGDGIFALNDDWPAGGQWRRRMLMPSG
jgi:hypothetical protein